MSNGNDHPNFPPPPNEPPETGGPKPNSDPRTDEGAKGSAAADEVTSSESTRPEQTGDPAANSADDSPHPSDPSPTEAQGSPDDSKPAETAAGSDSSEATQAMPAPGFGDDSSAQAAGSAQDTPSAQNGSSESSSTGPSDSSAPPESAASAFSDDKAPPLGQPGNEPTARPTVAPASPQSNQAPQHSNPGAQNGSSGPNTQYQSGPNAPFQNGQNQGAPSPSGQYPGSQPQGGQYPGAAPYPGAQNQAGPNQPGQPNQPGRYQQNQYQTGSGPNTQRTGSGPGQSQAIPQPAPAPGFAGSQAAATRADSRPEKTKKSKLPLFITLGAVALVAILVLVGFLVVGSVNKNNYGPDKVAEDYIAALNKGDFAAAEKIAPSPRPEGTNLDLLSKNFTEASSAKIEKAKVESSKVDGDKGKVIVSYELDGSQYNVELAAKKDGKQDLFFDKWKLTGPELNVISLDVPAADGLTVNGQDYTAKSGTTSFAVYPGNYDFKIPKSKWVSEASDTAGVNFPKAFAPGGQPNEGQVSPTTLNLDLSPTSAFQDEVQKQVDKEIKKCFDNKSIKPKCKFIKFDPTEIPVSGSDKELDDLAKDGTAKWSLKDKPKVKASFGAGDTNTGSFFTEKPGKFDFSVDGTKAGSSYFSNGNSLSVSGSVKIDGDKLTVEFFDF
ncbi:hypothetical protein [Brevibacterium spongiae]|uniref:DUF4878 domain-containing protein n=1 Tax=Brevibacterium spongiae TaxID=2909672 RepID=A0ABY5SRS3_9MICO|nr:hypothetical protein [Brevibacterium spongiae]UVI37260.1 hypothetical protein L1F31_06325 [Brevibacterium spongiae]